MCWLPFWSYRALHNPKGEEKKKERERIQSLIQNLNDLINPFLKTAYLVSLEVFYFPSTILVRVGLPKIVLE